MKLESQACVAEGDCSFDYHDDGAGTCVAFGCAAGHRGGGAGRGSGAGGGVGAGAGSGDTLESGDAMLSSPPSTSPFGGNGRPLRDRLITVLQPLGQETNATVTQPQTAAHAPAGPADK